MIEDYTEMFILAASVSVDTILGDIEKDLEERHEDFAPVKESCIKGLMEKLQKDLTKGE